MQPSLSATTVPRKQLSRRRPDPGRAQVTPRTSPRSAHETPNELLRQNPLLAAALLQGTGVEVPGGVSAVMAAGDLGSALPTELRAGVGIVSDGQGAWPGMQPRRLP